MYFTLTVFLFAAGLFTGMLLLLELGRRLGKKHLAAQEEGALPGSGAVDGAIFGLMGLLIAFTFSGAASRFDDRRQLIVEEANAIGTAYLRLDLLQSEPRDKLKDLFRQYLDTRLETYRRMANREEAQEEFELSVKLQSQIWQRAVSACQAEGNPPTTMLLLPALNAMIDITNTRASAFQFHPPSAIFAMLFLLTLASALLAGYGMAGGTTRSWTHMLSFSAALSVAVFVILDLEFPRHGFIRLDAFDHVLADLRASMN